MQAISTTFYYSQQGSDTVLIISQPSTLVVGTGCGPYRCSSRRSCGLIEPIGTFELELNRAVGTWASPTSCWPCWCRQLGRVWCRPLCQSPCSKRKRVPCSSQSSLTLPVWPNYLRPKGLSGYPWAASWDRVPPSLRCSCTPL